MKKAYLTPEMEIIETEIQQYLMAGSDAISIYGDEDPIVDPQNADAPSMDMEDLF